MKRELVLRVEGEQFTVTAWRDGADIVVSRDGEEHRVAVLSDAVVGFHESARRPTGDSAPKTAAPRKSAPKRIPAPRPKSSAQDGDVLAPMTGVIDQVLAPEGGEVAKGEVIVILEAMKMYIDVLAPAAGSVRGVAVKPGDNVRDGQLLLRIE